MSTEEMGKPASEAQIQQCPKHKIENTAINKSLVNTTYIAKTTYIMYLKLYKDT